MNIRDLESKIYETYYNLNPDGDARYKLWPAVIKAKNVTDAEKELQTLLERVEQGEF